MFANSICGGVFDTIFGPLRLKCMKNMCFLQKKVYPNIVCVLSSGVDLLRGWAIRPSTQHTGERGERRGESFMGLSWRLFRANSSNTATIWGCGIVLQRTHVCFWYLCTICVPRACNVTVLPHYEPRALCNAGRVSACCIRSLRLGGLSCV